METRDINRSITVTLNDDGTIRSIRAEVERLMQDASGTISYQHTGTKTKITSETMAAAFPNVAMLAQIKELIDRADDAEAKVAATETEKVSLQSQISALQAENDALKSPPLEVRPSSLFDGADFIARITDAEYSAILVAASKSIQLARWLDIFRLRGEIDVTGSTALSAKAGLVKAGLLTPDRADVIFATG